VLLIKIK